MRARRKSGPILDDATFDEMLQAPEHDWPAELVAEFERQNDSAPTWIARWKLIHREWRRRPDERESISDFHARLRREGKLTDE